MLWQFYGTAGDLMELYWGQLKQPISSANMQYACLWVILNEPRASQMNDISRRFVLFFQGGQAF